MTPLTGQELHNLAMNIVGEALQKELQWEFLLVNSELKRDPQFVCVDKNNQKYFIIVRAVPYGDDPTEYDIVFMEVVRKHAEKHNARPSISYLPSYRRATDTRTPWRFGEDRDVLPRSVVYGCLGEVLSEPAREKLLGKQRQLQSDMPSELYGQRYVVGYRIGGRQPIYNVAQRP